MNANPREKPDGPQCYVQVLPSIRQETPKVLNVTCVASKNCPSTEIPPRPYLVAGAGHRRRRTARLLVPDATPGRGDTKSAARARSVKSPLKTAKGNLPLSR